MIIPQDIIDELIAQARQDAPDETCGYLLGTSGPDGDVVTENYWMENIDHSPEHFSFAPKDQFAALRYARSKGLEDPRQLAQPSSLSLAPLAGRPPSGRRPQYPLRHPFSPRRHPSELLQDPEWGSHRQRGTFVTREIAGRIPFLSAIFALIPYFWYAECPIGGIAGVRKSPYLCSVK